MKSVLYEYQELEFVATPTEAKIGAGEFEAAIFLWVNGELVPQPCVRALSSIYGFS